MIDYPSMGHKVNLCNFFLHKLFYTPAEDFISRVTSYSYHAGNCSGIPAEECFNQSRTFNDSYIEDRRNRKNYIIKENRHIIEYDGYQHAVSIDKLYPENTRLAVKYLKSNPHHLIIETESTMSFWRNFTTVVQLMALTLLLFLFKNSINSYIKLRKNKTKLNEFVCSMPLALRLNILVHMQDNAD